MFSKNNVIEFRNFLWKFYLSLLIIKLSGAITKKNNTKNANENTQFQIFILVVHLKPKSVYFFFCRKLSMPTTIKKNIHLPAILDSPHEKNQFVFAYFFFNKWPQPNGRHFVPLPGKYFRKMFEICRLLFRSTRGIREP